MRENIRETEKARILCLRNQAKFRETKLPIRYVMIFKSFFQGLFEAIDYSLLTCRGQFGGKIGIYQDCGHLINLRFCSLEDSSGLCENEKSFKRSAMWGSFNKKI